MPSGLPKILPEQVVRAEQARPGMVGVTPENGDKPSPPEPPCFAAGCLLLATFQLSRLSHRNLVQANILDGGPDNGQSAALQSTRHRSDRCVGAH